MVCPIGFYGNNCSQACGHCAKNTTCETDTGNCTAGCLEGCTETNSTGEYYTRKEMMILYAALGCIILLIVCFSVLFIVRYRKRNNNRHQRGETNVRRDYITPVEERICVRSENGSPTEARVESEVFDDNVSINMYEHLLHDSSFPDPHKYQDLHSYGHLMKKSTSVRVQSFPDIYKRLLTICKDGKTALYYAFQTLHAAEQAYEYIEIDQETNEGFDIKNVSYKDLVTGNQSPLPDSGNIKTPKSTLSVQIDRLRILITDFTIKHPSFWDIFVNHNISTCVHVGKDAINQSDRYTVGGFVIECTSLGRSNNTTEATIALKSRATGSPTNITMINCGFWEDCMEVPIDLLSLVNLNNRLYNIVDEHPCILVQYENDLNRAVLFAVMLAMLAKMRKTRRVDILAPTLNVMKTIPSAISSYEQFKFLHDVVLLSIQKEKSETTV